MEDWRRDWRLIAPGLPTDGLERLRDALLHNSTNLIRGMYVRYGRDRDAASPLGVCAITMCLWGNRPFDESSSAYAHMLRTHVIMPLHTRAWEFVAWYDHNHREDYYPPSSCGIGELAPCAPSRLLVFKELLPEVSRELARRQNQEIDDGTLESGLAREDSPQTVPAGP